MVRMGAPGTPNPTRPVWLLALAWIAGFTLIDSSIVSLALPDIARDFDRSVGQLAWVSTGFLLALAATLLAAGRLGDRFGFRPVGIRRNYYQELHEDALVMWTDDIRTDGYAARLDEIASDMPEQVRRS